MLLEGNYYHVFNKSIAGFRIFHGPDDFGRMKNILQYYKCKNVLLPFTRFVEFSSIKQAGLWQSLIAFSNQKEQMVQIVAYCIMPTHIHLVVKQLSENGISMFMSNVLNSYARYFNLKYGRKGPLWVGRFKRVLIETDEQLWHVIRYLHLNPTTANLVQKPIQWSFSSYAEYLGFIDQEKSLSIKPDFMSMSSEKYKRFVESHIGYQKEMDLAKRFGECCQPQPTRLRKG